MSPRVIRWGIIGAGKIAERFAEDLHQSEFTEFYGIASRNLQKAKDFAFNFNATQSYGSYESLAKDSNIDAIYIATPHSFHKTHTLLCLAHKKPVLCEKPFAMNLVEVNEMIQAARDNDTLLMEALWTAFLPHFRYTAQLIKQNHFGKVLKFEADFGFHPEYDETSRVFNKSLGGGSLMDIGIYPIFAALSFFGLPKTIEASASFFGNDVDSKCDMIFNYDSVKAYLKSTLLEVTNTEAKFYCEQGIIKINSRFHEPTSVELIDENGKSELKTFDNYTHGYSYEIEHFNELIRVDKKESPIMSFDRSIELITTVDKVRTLINLKY